MISTVGAGWKASLNNSVILIITTVSMDRWITVHVKKVTWSFGLSLCKMVPFVSSVPYTYTGLGLSAICIMRLLSHTIMKRSFRENPVFMTVVFSSISGFASIVVNCPVPIYHRIHTFHSFTFCGSEFPSAHAHMVFYVSHFIVGFGIPVFIIWSINPIMFCLRRAFFAPNSTETVTYLRQHYDKALFHGNGCTENGGHVMKEEINDNHDHIVIKHDLPLIVGTVDVNEDLKRENKVTLLLFLLSLFFTLLLAPLYCLLFLHIFSSNILHDDVYRASTASHMIHIFYPASIPLVSFACSAPLRHGIIKPIRAVVPRSNTYSKV
ncbi:uncharacterized protein [Antedon mediterranea]|uniref:uncharacterized protein isoform X2 n=1 Tax=Antedon mediterranea TaxID=105859 RepID=UPI003AF4E82B